MPIRNTRQRDAITEVFRTSSVPLSPQQVLAEAKQSLPRISQATVYRVIKGLLEEGTIVAMQLPGQPPVYEQAGRKHHHFFRCRQCDRMYEVEGCGGLLKALTPRGFRLEEHEVFLKGICAGCLKTS